MVLLIMLGCGVLFFNGSATPTCIYTFNRFCYLLANFVPINQLTCINYEPIKMLNFLCKFKNKVINNGGFSIVHIAK